MRLARSRHHYDGAFAGFRIVADRSVRGEPGDVRALRLRPRPPARHQCGARDTAGSRSCSSRTGTAVSAQLRLSERHDRKRGYVVRAGLPGHDEADCVRTAARRPAISSSSRRAISRSCARCCERDGIGYRVRGQRTGLVGHSLRRHAATNASIADRRFPAVALLAPFVGAAAFDRVRDLRPRRACSCGRRPADTTVPISSSCRSSTGSRSRRSS